MSDKLTLSLLRSGPEGTKEWNRLRAEVPEVPDFNESNLYRVDLRGANLRGLDFHQVDLGDADLRGADLAGAQFYRTYLHGTKIDAKWFRPDAEVHGLPVIVGGGDD